jgi:hypothetical protein
MQQLHCHAQMVDRVEGKALVLSRVIVYLRCPIVLVL